jgi:hypothetical protein
MPWKTPDDYDRTNVRYIRCRRWRDRFRLSQLIVAAPIVFAIVRFVAQDLL